ncbi:phosphatase PAP2 family protein [Fulvivirga sp. M361]|uniref:phosphatase PAP2 family protein n=1 Tax=Fulvivirga sp. M361 TaxID=2594266 RepID=UPI00117B20EC|nr:phosphatase PAP2 family protein [Fulvivirga sp. M361]TRX62610.1 phosphatase PAP2 family protein [Fulvivirga sp. M361]
MKGLLNSLPSWPKLIKELYNNKKEYFLFIFSLLIAGGIGTIALGFFLTILQDLYGTGLNQFDQSVFELIHGLRSESLTIVITFITHLGGAPMYFVLIPLIGLLLYYRGHSWKLAIQSSIVLFTAFALNAGLKYFIARPRPLADIRLIEAYSYSFPSGHSMSATAFYGFLIYLTFKYVRRGFWKAFLSLGLLSLILGIGLSRIYLGVHYATDVFAGFVAGLSWLMICIILIRSVEFYRSTDHLSDSDPHN